MTMKRWLSQLMILAALFLAIACGGCGGGSSDAPTPSPSPTPAPPTPNYELDLSILDGTWTGTSGSGTATGQGGTFTIRMTSATARLSDARANGSIGTARLVSYSSYWDAYQNGMRTTSVPVQRSSDTFRLRRTGSNMWEFIDPIGWATVTVALLSETSAYVTEEGIIDVDDYLYRYTASYTMTKTSSPTPTPSYELDLSILNGAWTGTSGSGTATGHDGTFTISMTRATARVSDAWADGSTGTARLASYSSHWDVFQNGTRFEPVSVPRAGDVFSLRRTGSNTWEFVDPSGWLTATIELLSETSAWVTEEGIAEIGGWRYRYTASYGMTKTSSPVPTPSPTPTPTTEIDVSSLDGSWEASSGTGTATGYDGTFDLDLTYGAASFTGTRSTGDSATTRTTANASWRVTQGGSWIKTIDLDHYDESITLTRTETNTWEWSLSGRSRLTFTLTSSTTATVVEEGIFTLDGWQYRYTVSYTMTKTSTPTPAPSPELDFGTPAGWWEVVSSSGTAKGVNAFDLDMSYGTASFVDTWGADNSATATLTALASWNVLHSGTQVGTIDLDHAITLARTGINTWEWALSERSLIITLTSSTTATVTEEGVFTFDGWQYRYTVSYAMAKTSSPTPIPTPTPELDISILDGSWAASSGSGTATEQGTVFDFDLELIYGTASFIDTRSVGNTATATMRAEERWWIGGIGGAPIHFHHHEDDPITIVHTGANTWEWAFPSGKGRLIFTLTSSTTAAVIQDGLIDMASGQYQYTSCYRMTKIR